MGWSIEHTLFSFAWAWILTWRNHDKERHGPLWKAFVFLVIVHSVSGVLLYEVLDLPERYARFHGDIAALFSILMVCRTARYLLKYEKTFF